MCDSAKRLGKSVPLFCLFSYFCAPCALFSLRSETREKFGIEVDTYLVFNTKFLLYNHISRKIMPLFLIREVLEWIVPVAAAAHFA